MNFSWKKQVFSKHRENSGFPSFYTIHFTHFTSSIEWVCQPSKYSSIRFNLYSRSGSQRVLFRFRNYFYLFWFWFGNSSSMLSGNHLRKLCLFIKLYINIEKIVRKIFSINFMTYSFLILSFKAFHLKASIEFLFQLVHDLQKQLVELYTH